MGWGTIKVYDPWELVNLWIEISSVAPEIRIYGLTVAWWRSWNFMVTQIKLKRYLCYNDHFVITQYIVALCFPAFWCDFLSRATTFQGRLSLRKWIIQWQMVFFLKKLFLHVYFRTSNPSMSDFKGLNSKRHWKKQKKKILSWP